MTDRFFAAANTGCGFLSDFKEIFAPEKYRRIYVIKGGPGTGKSTFMKRLGAEAARRGYDTKYVYCSSDVRSLDGVIIDALGVCVLDGTAPHTTDPKYPGACEVILNFGDAFDTAALEKRRDDIERHTAASAENYSRAYGALAAAKTFCDAEISASRRAFLSKKAAAFSRRVFSDAEKGEISYRRCRTVCRDGEYRLPFFFDEAIKIIAVPVYNGIGRLLVAAAAEYAVSSGIKSVICRDAICPSMPDAVIAGGVCIAVDGDDLEKKDNAKRVDPRRFADAAALRSERGYLRLCEKLRADSVRAAVGCMALAGEHHDELEKIYAAHTDFSVIDGMLSRVKNDVFEN